MPPQSSKAKTANSRIGVVLNEDLAAEIYRCKLALKSTSCGENAESRNRGQSLPVSREFGVSPKTIRDIWSRRTWTCATYHLWIDEVDDTNPGLHHKNPPTRVSFAAAHDEYCHKIIVPVRLLQYPCDKVMLLILYCNFSQVNPFLQLSYRPKTLTGRSIAKPKHFKSKLPVSEHAGVGIEAELRQSAQVLPNSCSDPNCQVCCGHQFLWTDLDGRPAPSHGTAGETAKAAERDPFHFDWSHW